MYHLTKKGKGLFSMTLYKGQIKNHKRNGFGIQLFPNSCFYIGFWKNNQPEGKGKLVIKDGTSYEGDFLKGYISKGMIKYYNGSIYEGEFDGTPFERIKNGIFRFNNDILLKATWKEGFIVDGILYDGNKEVANLKKEPTIIYCKSGNGVIISKKNKWIYEGGIKNNRCYGSGVIFCTFQQYKSGNFKEDKINGNSYKMSINWGEITNGNCEMDVKVGKWVKFLNKGYKVEYNIKEKEAKVTFPFLNEDYYQGIVQFNSKKYGLNLKKGIYYLKKKSKDFEKIEIRNVEDIYQIDKIKNRGFSFNFTFNKIFEDEKLLVELKEYLSKVLTKDIISTKIYDTYFKDFLKEESSSLNFTEIPIDNFKISFFEKEDKKIVKSQIRTRPPKLTKKKRAITPNIKNNKNFNEKKTLEYSDYLDIKKNKRFLECDSDKLLESLNLNNDIQNNVFRKNILKTQDTLRKNNNLLNKIPINKKNKYKNFKKFEKLDQNLLLTKNEIKNSKVSKITQNEIKFDKIESENETSSVTGSRKKKRKKKSFYNNSLKIETLKIEDPIEYFEGATKKGKFIGFCIVLYKSGLFLQGNFQEGILNGLGTMVLTNGIEYKGNFVNGLIEGEGIIIIENKEYIGVYKSGSFSNKEIMSGTDNTHFVFKNSLERKKKSGLVNIYFKNNYKLVDCRMEKNTLANEKCKLFNKDGEYWIGKIQRKKGYYNFESLSGTKRTFHIFLENQSLVQMYI